MTLNGDWHLETASLRLGCRIGGPQHEVLPLLRQQRTRTFARRICVLSRRLESKKRPRERRLSPEGAEGECGEETTEESSAPRIDLPPSLAVLKEPRNARQNNKLSIITLNPKPLSLNCE
jgi:hypothetical protein